MACVCHSSDSLRFCFCLRLDTPLCPFVDSMSVATQPPSVMVNAPSPTKAVTSSDRSPALRKRSTRCSMTDQNLPAQLKIQSVGPNSTTDWVMSCRKSPSSWQKRALLPECMLTCHQVILSSARAVSMPRLDGSPWQRCGKGSRLLSLGVRSIPTYGGMQWSLQSKGAGTMLVYR